MVTETSSVPMHGRILGLYALSVMEAEGSLYGYRLADRIADRTEGGWRPGAGAVYPALESLTRRNLARVTTEGRRRVYRITPRGRSVLRQIRRNLSWRTRGAPDLSMLWSEVVGTDDVGTFLLLRLRRSLDAIDAALGTQARSGSSTLGVRSLRANVIAELAARLESLRQGETRPVAVIASRREGGRP